MTFSQDEFFRAVASRQIPRIRVAAIVMHRDSVLVQRPADDATACYALVGGEYEIGDTLESRLRKEFQEETNARVVQCRYVFCVENSFRYKDSLVQQLEHIFLVKLDRNDVSSREPHLLHTWIPLVDLAGVDLRPQVIRQSLIDGTYLTTRHMVQRQQ